MSGIETMILTLREAGFPLILLWLLTLSVVYGILSHIQLPKSLSARGVISIVAAFMVLFAAAAQEATVFIENIVLSGVIIAFALLIVMIFLELTGTKAEGKHIFEKHPMQFALALILLVILIFIGAGGLGILNIPSFEINEPMIAIIFFLIIMLTAIWLLVKESSDNK
ncbi:MAG: hypothetical protein J7K26_03400 [Candidatus Aenigmarchaeota archaeon]|nr:hypothetical protein [Candidatus Aenigmarchaeota archaeon]